MSSERINVSSEIGTLRRLLIHSPDAGIGKIVPRIKDELLYDDIVYLDKMREEYHEYLQVLLWFLDPEVIKNKPLGKEYFLPSNENYFQSDKVMDAEQLLVRVLRNDKVKIALVVSVCALEDLDFTLQNKLLFLDENQLARVLITGVFEENGTDIFLFSPIPNLIFTRDVGITINNHLLLTKFSEEARKREALLIKYIFYYEVFKEGHNSDNNTFSERIIEISQDESSFRSDEPSYVTFEGGDIMMISPRHLFIGSSERTSHKAIEKVAETLFRKNLVDKVSVIGIPAKRSYMHIDTVFTQVRKDMWIVFGPFSKRGMTLQQDKTDVGGLLEGKTVSKSQINIKQLKRIPDGDSYKVEMNTLPYLDDLFEQVSKEDFGADKCEIIYSAGGEFPYNEREQWTDSCNFLAIKEGVIIGYDRNVKTAAEFKRKGFKVITSSEFIADMESGKELDEVISGDTLILLPSSELSRARGGTHCMSMPLLRD